MIYVEPSKTPIDNTVNDPEDADRTTQREKAHEKRRNLNLRKEFCDRHDEFLVDEIVMHEQQERCDWKTVSYGIIDLIIKFYSDTERQRPV